MQQNNFNDIRIDTGKKIKKIFKTFLQHVARKYPAFPTCCTFYVK